MELQILHQNRDFVVCIKPTGVLSQGGKPGEETMLQLLENQLGGRFFPVHRLDREVGGVMVYARTSRAAGELSKVIQNGEMKKEYLAVVKGKPEPEAGIYEDLLLHDQRKNKSYVVKRLRGGVKKAKLAYGVLSAGEEASLVQVRLYTGRSHQIRVQFASRGMPLLGDGRYGGGSGGIALCSVRISFPFGKQAYCFSALPEAVGGISDLPALRNME